MTALLHGCVHSGGDGARRWVSSRRSMAASNVQPTWAKGRDACPGERVFGLSLELRMRLSRQGLKGVPEDFQVFPRPFDGCQRSRRRRRSPCGERRRRCLRWHEKRCGSAVGRARLSGGSLWSSLERDLINLSRWERSSRGRGIMRGLGRAHLRQCLIVDAVPFLFVDRMGVVVVGGQEDGAWCTTEGLLFESLNDPAKGGLAPKREDGPPLGVGVVIPFAPIPPMAFVQEQIMQLL